MESLCKQDRVLLCIKLSLPINMLAARRATEIVPEEEGRRWTKPRTLERGRALGTGFEPPSESNGQHLNFSVYVHSSKQVFDFLHMTS